MRPLDHNEGLYLAMKWRELLVVNRIQVIGAVVVVLLLLMALGLIAVVTFRGGLANAVSGAVVGLMLLGLVFLFGFIVFIRRRRWRVAAPSSPTTVAIEGLFWEKSYARSMTRCGIGESYLAVPPHWLPLLRRAGASRVLSAEAVGGPAEALILLTVNETLSVSRDVERGLLLVRDPLLPVFAMLALVGFMLAGIGSAICYDPDLTLWRYISVGPGLTRFASVGELPFTSWDLRAT